MKIFDAVVHPPGSEKEYQETIKKLRESDVFGALAIPLPGMPFEIRTFVERCRKSNFYHPVALFSPYKNVQNQVLEAKELNCYGIKVHPRFSNWDWTSSAEEEKLRQLFEACEKQNLPIFFCTYYSCHISIFPKRDPIYIFSKMLFEYPSVRVIFMHAGGHKLLDYIEMARFNNNILLDLSFTLLKYRGSSVDFDLLYALENFDKRVCFGSDAPYHDIGEVKSHLEKLLYQISPSRDYVNQHRVWSKNILEFLKI